MLPIYQPETAPVSIQDILAGTVLPIGAWVAPPPAGVSGNNPDYITDETYRLAKEAGFTMLYGLYENGAGPDTGRVRASRLFRRSCL